MVRQYDVLPGSYCKELINIFENSSHQEFINDDHKPCFTQVNLNREKVEMVREMIPVIKGVRQMYQTDTKSRFLPEMKLLKSLGSKKGIFLNGEERFDEHVDITDHVSARKSSGIFVLFERQ